MSARSRTIGLIVGAIAIAAGTIYVTVGRPSRSSAHIASVLILSGDFASYGEQFRSGAVLAADDLNGTGATPRIELSFHDSQGEKTRATEIVRALSEQDKVSYLADVMGTGLALEVAPLINERKMLVLSGVNTGPELTTVGGPYFFRVIPSDGVASRELAAWARERGFSRAALVRDVDDWATGLSAEIRRAFTNLGGEIVADIECPKGIQLLDPIAARVSAASPEVVFLLVYPREAGLLVKAAKRRGLTAPFMGTDNLTGTEFTEHAQQAAQDVLYVVPGEPATLTESAKAFRAAYLQKHGVKEPPLFAVMGYDVVTILGDLVRRFGADTNAAAAYLASAQDEGASGVIRFDENGDVRTPRYRRLRFALNPSGRMESLAVGSQ